MKFKNLFFHSMLMFLAANTSFAQDPADTDFEPTPPKYGELTEEAARELEELNRETEHKESIKTSEHPEIGRYRKGDEFKPLPVPLGRQFREDLWEGEVPVQHSGGRTTAGVKAAVTIFPTYATSGDGPFKFENYPNAVFDIDALHAEVETTPLRTGDVDSRLGKTAAKVRASYYQNDEKENAPDAPRPIDFIELGLTSDPDHAKPKPTVSVAAGTGLTSNGINVAKTQREGGYSQVNTSAALQAGYSIDGNAPFIGVDLNAEGIKCTPTKEADGSIDRKNLVCIGGKIGANGALAEHPVFGLTVMGEIAYIRSLTPKKPTMDYFKAGLQAGVVVHRVEGPEKNFTEFPVLVTVGGTFGGGYQRIVPLTDPLGNTSKDRNGNLRVKGVSDAPRDGSKYEELQSTPEDGIPRIRIDDPTSDDGINVGPR